MRKRTNARQSISEQVERVQAEVRRLNMMLATFNPDLPPNQLSPEWIRASIEGRRRREEIFGNAIFGDPAWDILLELYAHELEGARATVSDVFTATAVAYTTALGWVGKLEREGFVTRTQDTRDLRRVFVGLTKWAVSGMEQYFGALPSEAGH